MKRIFLLGFILSLCFCTYSQQKRSKGRDSGKEHFFGVTFGTNLAYGRLTDEVYSDLTPSLFPRLLGGFFYQTHTTIRFSFKYGMNYSAKGLLYKREKVGFDYTLRADYIETYSLATFSFLSSKRKFDPYVTAGFYFGVPVAGNIESVTSSGINLGPLIVTRENLAPTDLGMKIGFGANYRFQGRKTYKVQFQVVQSNSFYDSFGLNEANNFPTIGKRKLKAIEITTAFLIPIR